MIPDRVYLCPLIYGQIVFYCRLLSCTIRADGISVNGGIHRHRPVCVEVVPLLVVGEPALHWLPISVIAPLAAVILLRAVCGLRVNDDLHKPPQNGGSFRPGRLFPSIMLLPAPHRKLRSGIKIHCILPDSEASAPHSQPELLLSVYISLYDLHFAATCKSRLCIHRHRHNRSSRKRYCEHPYKIMFSPHSPSSFLI